MRLGEFVLRVVAVEVECDAMEGKPPPEVVDHQRGHQHDDDDDRAHRPETREERERLGIVFAERRAEDGDDATIEQLPDRRAEQERRQTNLCRAHDK